MSTVKKEQAQQNKVPKVRYTVTLSSTKLRDVEQACANMAKIARHPENKAKLYGPARMPVKKLRVTVRRTPCGQGTATFENHTMHIYKRVIVLQGTEQDAKQITGIRIAPSVDVTITAQKA